MALSTVGMAQDGTGTDLGDEMFDTSLAPRIGDEVLPESVVGGTPVKNKWDDTVGIVFYDAYVGCTGTLIGPKLVITAGHCVQNTDITSVLIGNKDWWVDKGGEEIDVVEVIEYPDSWATYDAAVLVLEERSSYEPRAVGLDCILDEYLKDGAPIEIVGYGVTSESGSGYNTTLMQGESSVADADCSEEFINGVWAGCNPSVQPAGEIAAGGNGVDACFGDSGGPLYLLTPEGDYVVGITSRAFAGVPAAYPCRDGGIWVRPDAIIDWIEEVSGLKATYPSCNDAPTATAELLVARVGKEGTTKVVVEDVDGDPALATFAIAATPLHGTATADAAGVVTYVPNEGFKGADSVVVTVTDEGRKPYKARSGAPVSVDVAVQVEVRSILSVGGCETTRLGWAALAGVALLRRRRLR